MTEITIFTDGKAIHCRSARIYPACVPGKFICRMQLLIGRQEIIVYFDNPEELTTFCRRHRYELDISGYVPQQETP